VFADSIIGFKMIRKKISIGTAGINLSPEGNKEIHILPQWPYWQLCHCNPRPHIGSDLALCHFLLP
jgi:hypothetical protein